MNAQTPIRDYALELMNQLLTRLALQVHRAAQHPGPDEIHDVRVSIRRFDQCLILFDDFFPANVVGKIKRRLKRMMRLTSEIRDRDIALEFLDTRHRAHRRRFKRERAAYERQLSHLVRRWNARDFSAKWREALSLKTL